jgi:hypothetical protein
MSANTDIGVPVTDLARPMSDETSASLRILAWVSGESFDPTMTEHDAQRALARLLQAPHSSADLGAVLP